MITSMSGEGFSYAEAQRVVEEYLCATCEGPLQIAARNETFRYDVICLSHGSVELCGRLTKKTVALEAERAHYQFGQVVQNLADLFPEVVNSSRDEKKILGELGF